MKKELVFLGILGIFIFVVACVPPAEQPPAGTPAQETAAQEGRVVFTITDAAADMGAVTSVKVTVDAVRVHSATEGWVTVSEESKTFDLLQLKAEGSQALLADAQLKEGTYQQLRLDISTVIVTDAEGDHEAKLPSGELKIVGDLDVNADSTSTATFDFLVNESLHITGNGKYILAPVVQLETRENAEVEVTSRNRVEINAGNVKTKVKVGMDEEGRVGVGLGIPARINVSIEGGRIHVGSGVGVGLGTRGNQSGSAESQVDANAEAEVEVGVYS